MKATRLRWLIAGALLAVVLWVAVTAGLALYLQASTTFGDVYGPLAGIIGLKKFIYDIWGDTVNTASRLESHGTPGRIQVTSETAERLAQTFRFEPRGMVELKGKGSVECHYLIGKLERP